MNYDVIVVGAGAAGLVAAERAAARGRRTLLLEKNPKPGIKILMSGGTRCNLTHATDSRGIVAAYGLPGRFLHSALASLSPQDLVALVEAEGVATKIEETGKIFPVSNRAADILRAFMARLERSGCEMATGESLDELTREDDGFRLVTTVRTLSARRVVVTTGGRSYPKSGTTGDGYRWAAAFGHTLVTPRAALTPIVTPAEWVRALRGVTIPDAVLRLVDPAERRRPLDNRRGSLLFTHFGLSGPVALDISRSISGHPQPQSLELVVDFLPSIATETLDERLRSQAAVEGKKQLAALVPEAVPRRLADALIERAGLNPAKRCAEVGKADRAALLAALKQTCMPIEGVRGFQHAEVTAGGVSLDEVDSRTLESKLVAGLHFAGEVLDLDGPIGGFNFQAAFSTGWLAGLSV